MKSDLINYPIPLIEVSRKKTPFYFSMMNTSRGAITPFNQVKRKACIFSGWKSTQGPNTGEEAARADYREKENQQIRAHSPLAQTHIIQ